MRDLDSDVLSALDAFRDRNQLEVDPREAALACVRNDFVETTKRWWGGRGTRTGTVFAILTATHVFALVRDEPGGPVATIAYRTRDLEVRDYESTPGHRLIEDAGLELTGFAPGAVERSTYFLGLGPETDGVAFRRAVRAATSGGA